MELSFDALWPPRARRVTKGSGRAHIEVRGIHRPGTEPVARTVESRLRAIKGVHWAEVNAVLAVVTVAFDDDTVDVDDLVDAVDVAEDAFGIEHDDVIADRPDFPGDLDVIRFGVIELGADLLGIGLGGVARALRAPLLPIEIASALPALDSLPPIRRVLDRHKTLDASVVSASALLLGLAAGPVGLAVDATHRVFTLREATARRAAWQRAEPHLHDPANDTRPAPFARQPRPVPLPDGALERYARRVAVATVGAGGLALALTRDPRRSADVMLSGVPRAARLGREAFAAELDRVLADHDVVSMDTRVLRRLDRIDTVVVDGELLEHDGPDLRALFAATRDAAQDLVIAGSDNDRTRVPNADLFVGGGDALVASVRALQAEGRIVALVSSRNAEALHHADCGIGVSSPGDRAPWGAHLLCATLDGAALVVAATVAAREASRHAVQIAAAGSAIASLFAIGPFPNPARRAILTNNVASFGAIAVGAWTGARVTGPALPITPADEVPWHALAGNDVARRLHADVHDGLTDDDARTRHVETATEHSATFPTLLVRELQNPLTAVLGAAGALSAVSGSVTDSVLLGGVLGVNAMFGAGQRLRTEHAISSLRASVSSRVAHIRRAGIRQSAAPSELVEGDIALFEAGDVVPADVRLVDAQHLELDESSLTGESLPVTKRADAVGVDTPVAERSSMVYAGSTIVAGYGEGLVVAIGDHTEAERASASSGDAPPSGVETRLEDLTRRTVPLVIAAGATLTGVSLLRGVSTREAVSTGVTLAAAAVPEGLPFVATAAQAGAARRLSERGVLVRNPRVLEALGRVDVLCFDKTGTLTEGQLQLRAASDGEHIETMPHIGGRRRVVLAAALRATPRARGSKLPHPTDQAIVDGASEIEVPIDLGAPSWHKVASLPFSSDRGYHAVLGRCAEASLLSVKGAPEVVLPRCANIDAARRARIDRHIEQLARDGLRVLAVAERAASGRADLDDKRVDRLQLLGFVGVADVARSSAIDPIHRLQQAGISVVMLTGDHPSTANAVAKELGVLNGGGVLSGSDIDGLDNDALDERIENVTVFARVTPAQKVRIVRALQRRGRTVAMTGDGANDAQAIRLADIGIAFGPRATSAARAAADLVVVDDAVETLISAITEGRAMWASVRDALALLLGGNLGEVLFSTAGTIIAGRSPLNPRQLLAVNLLTDLAPAMAIAARPPQSATINLRREGPESSLGGQLIREIAIRAAATSAGAGAAWTVARIIGSPKRARTVALAALVGSQLGQTIVVGYRSPLVVVSGLASVGVLAAIIQTPGVSQFFGCTPLGPVSWALAGASSTAATVGAVAADAVLRRRDAA